MNILYFLIILRDKPTIPACPMALGNKSLLHQKTLDRYRLEFSKRRFNKRMIKCQINSATQRQQTRSVPVRNLTASAARTMRRCDKSRFIARCLLPYERCNAAELDYGRHPDTLFNLA